MVQKCGLSKIQRYGSCRTGQYFGFIYIYTFETNISLIRLFSLMMNCAKPRLSKLKIIFLLRERHEVDGFHTFIIPLRLID